MGLAGKSYWMEIFMPTATAASEVAVEIIQTLFQCLLRASPVNGGTMSMEKTNSMPAL